MKSKVVLLVVLAIIVALQLRMVWLMPDTENAHDAIVSGFFWAAALTLLWQKRDNLSLESSVFSRFFGLLLVSWGLIMSLFLFNPHNIFIEIFIFVAVLGLCLFASGFKGLKQYSQELTIIFILSCLPKINFIIFIDKVFHINSLVASFSTFILWYLGFEVHRQDTSVIMPTGSIQITPGCSGLTLMWLLLQLTVLFILMFRIKVYQKILLPLIAALISFVVMGCRAIILTLSIASSNQAAFAYWHGEYGSHIFSTIAISIFVLFTQFLLKYQDRGKNQSIYKKYVQL